MEVAYTLSIGTEISDLGWPWTGISHSCFTIHAFSEPITKIWMQIDPYYRWQKCNAMTVVSGNIRFMQIFSGVPWRRGVRRQWGNRKRRFSELSDGTSELCLRQLTKWGERYYIVLVSPLSPLHHPNHPEWPFYVQFLRATASMLSAHMLSQFRLSVCPSVCPSVRHTGDSCKNGWS